MKLLIIPTLLLLCTACGRPAPEKEVHRILSERTMTLATAESCTGGMLATRFTALPGASVYYKGGIVAYSHSAKRDLLGVDCRTIGLHGVVSEAVVREMAEGARKTLNADYAIATTGIAGPTGGTPQTPVGTVWIAVATPEHTVSICFSGGSSRSEVIGLASDAALGLLLGELNEVPAAGQ